MTKNVEFCKVSSLGGGGGGFNICSLDHYASQPHETAICFVDTWSVPEMMLDFKLVMLGLRHHRSNTGIIYHSVDFNYSYRVRSSHRHLP